jgi:hypothetical protein
MKAIKTSDGRDRGCRLVVRNITGIGEERGFRLYWQPAGTCGDAFPRWDSSLIPALGLVTSNPFRTARLAKAYARRAWPDEHCFMLRD